MKRYHFFMFFCLVIFSFTNEKALAQCPVTITPSPATVCVGQAVTLTASGATSYTWGPGGFITPAVSVAPTVNTIYTVTATSGTCTATQTVIVNVIALPIISATSDDICIGGTGTLTASNAVSYTWSTGYVGNPLVQSPVTTTNYSVQGTSAAGCVGTATASITVHPLPPVAVNSATICIGSSATLTATGASNYSWSNGGIGATITPSPTVSPTCYTVTGTSPFGCVNTATACVTVNPLPTVTVNSATVCANTTATLTASGAATYSWNTGATTSSITPSPSSTTNYTVTGTNAQGCKDFTTTIVSTLASPTVVATNTVICPATCATLTATGATSYTWSANAGSVTTNTMSACPTSTSQFSVTGENAAGCKDSTTAVITVYLNTVDITPPVGTNTLYCTNVAYQFGSVDTTSGSFGVQYYHWYCAPSQSVTIVPSTNNCSICNGPTITFDTTGIYTLTVIVNLTSGCMDSAKYTLSVIQTPTIVTSPYSAFVCQGGPVGTMLYVSGAGNNGTYNWSPTINIATQYAAGDSVLINPPNLGVYNYTVVGTNSDGCPSAPSVVTATVDLPPVISAYSGSYPPLVTDSICSLTSTSIHMDPSYVITGSTYTWTAAPTANIGTPFSHSSPVTPQYTGNVDTTYVYYGNVAIPGCPSYPTYTVYVVVVPSPTVHVVSDTVENCNKMGDSLFVNSNPPTGVNYNWTPNYNISTTVGNAVFVHPTVPETYYVLPNIHVGTHICYGKPDSVKVLIGDTMLAGINVQYDIACRGTTDTLIANPPRTPLNGTYQYYWSIPATATGTTTSTGDTLVISPFALGVYTLTVTGTCVRKNTAQAFIAVNDCSYPFQASFTETADTICRRKCITYTDLTINSVVKPLWYRWTFTVQPPQISIFCLGAPGCVIRHDTVWFETTDSSNIPKIKVCYYQNSALNGAFPVTETVSHDPNFVAGSAHSTSTVVTIYDGPLALATKTQTINLGDAVTISGLQSSGTLATLAGYSWYPATALSCTNCATPTANPSVTTQYVLTVTDHNGCTDTSNITIFVDEICFEPFVPSGFSPNGDQLNDILYVRSNCLKNFTFKVYDRWGEKVFETDDLTKGWDGHFRGAPMNAGVFMYTLEGYQNTGGKEIRQKGNITLVK